MTNYEIFNLLFSGGNFSRPYLLKFTSEGQTSLLFTNNNEDYTYNGEIYKAANFKYYRPDTSGQGGSLEISSVPGENELFEFIENAGNNYKLEVIGLIDINGTATPIESYSHFYGSVSVDKIGTIKYTLAGDDRKNMNFPPYVYDTENNPGNA